MRLPVIRRFKRRHTHRLSFKFKIMLYKKLFSLYQLVNFLAAGPENDKSKDVKEVCDPYTSKCIDAECVPGDVRALVITNPNSESIWNAVTHIGEPINITYTIIPSDQELDQLEFPKKNVEIYFKRVGEKEFNFMTNIPKGKSWAMYTFENLSPGEYEIVGLVDGIDFYEKVKKNSRPSCIADQFPVGKSSTFNLYQKISIPNYQDKFGPNSATSNFIPLLSFLIFAFL